MPPKGKRTKRGGSPAQARRPTIADHGKNKPMVFIECTREHYDRLDDEGQAHMREKARVQLDHYDARAKEEKKERRSKAQKNLFGGSADAGSSVQHAASPQKKKRENYYTPSPDSGFSPNDPRRTATRSSLAEIVDTPSPKKSKVKDERTN